MVGHHEMLIKPPHTKNPLRLPCAALVRRAPLVLQHVIDARTKPAGAHAIVYGDIDATQGRIQPQVTIACRRAQKSHQHLAEHTRRLSCSPCNFF